MTRRDQALRELESGGWQDYREPGQQLAALVCLFDGRTLLASMAVFTGDDLTIDAAKADLLSCEGLAEQDASWVCLRP